MKQCVFHQVMLSAVWFVGNCEATPFPPNLRIAGNPPRTRDWDLDLPRLRTIPEGLGCVHGSSG
jgi:hypothetical protein